MSEKFREYAYSFLAFIFPIIFCCCCCMKKRARRGQDGEPGSAFRVVRRQAQLDQALCSGVVSRRTQWALGQLVQVALGLCFGWGRLVLGPEILISVLGRVLVCDFFLLGWFLCV